MRSALRIFAVFLMLIGVGWFFQGIGVLPGSLMTGEPRWAVYGVLAVLGGVGLFVLGSRLRSSPPAGRS